LIYRTNAQSRVLEEACVIHNVPYVQFGSSTSFYKRQEIKDVLAYLRWLYNGNDRGSMLRVFKTPAKGLGDKAVLEFDNYCGLVSEYVATNRRPGAKRPDPLEILLSLSSEEDNCMWGPNAPLPSDTISTRPLKLLKDFAQQMKDLLEKAYEEPLEQIISRVVQQFAIFPYLDKISKTTAEFEERKANVRELLNAAQRYTADGPCLLRQSTTTESQTRGDDDDDDDDVMESPLGNYLDDVALVTDMADQGRDSEDKRFKVCLMTIHASKGMEFDTVYVVGNEDGTFPTSQALAKGEGSVVLEEEKRLCYVAMTRAKTELLMTWRREVPVFTAQGIRTVSKDRSRFLNVLVNKTGKKGESRRVPSTTTKKRPTVDGTNSVFAQKKSLQRDSHTSPRRSLGNTGDSPRSHNYSPVIRLSTLQTKYTDPRNELFPRNNLYNELEPNQCFREKALDY
jgi:DNA helicase-2/ATP-dependent DNA helicase PcrA